MNNPKSFGRDDLMAVSAVRYCLGRQTYVVSDCADWLIDQWENIDPRMQVVIKRDVEDALKRENEGRANCDRQQWERVRKLWEGK